MSGEETFPFLVPLGRHGQSPKDCGQRKKKSSGIQRQKNVAKKEKPSGPMPDGFSKVKSDGQV
jgi:hypothetical protein